MLRLTCLTYGRITLACLLVDLGVPVSRPPVERTPAYAVPYPLGGTALQGLKKLDPDLIVGNVEL